jgi:hypothetical protein
MDKIFAEAKSASFIPHPDIRSVADADDLDRAEIRDTPGTGLQVLWERTFGNIVAGPELFNHPAERVAKILFKKPGQVFQHDPQLTQVGRSIFTITDLLLRSCAWQTGCNKYTLRVVWQQEERFACGRSTGSDRIIVRDVPYSGRNKRPGRNLTRNRILR